MRFSLKVIIAGKPNNGGGLNAQIANAALKRAPEKSKKHNIPLTLQKNNC